VRFAFTLRTPQQARHLFAAAHPRSRLSDLLGGPDLPAAVAVNGREVPVDATLERAGLRDGGVVGVMARADAGGAAVPTAAPGTLALLVASGPAAGASVTVPGSGGVVGRRTPIRLHDDEVSERHLALLVGAGGVAVADVGSANGTVIAGERVRDERPVAPGELIWAGRSALTVATAPSADAALSAGDDGGLRYSRSPRLLEPPRARPIAVPEPPPEPERAPFPMLAVAAPVLAGLLMAVLLKNPEYLAFTALSPIMVIGNVVSERRRGKGGYRRRMADYEQRREQALADGASARQAELAYRRHVHPDPATLLLIAGAPSHRLWERRPDDNDFLTLRTGTGTVAWSPPEPGRPAAHPAGQEGATDGDLLDAPVVLELGDCGAIGITGPAHLTRALARSMLLSLTVLHSPGEVAVTVLTTPDAEADWDWLRWLPHARQPASHEGVVRVGNDPDSIRLRLAELAAVLEARRAESLHGRSRSRPLPAEVVVLDDSYQLRLGSELGPLLRDGPAAGIYFLCLDDTPTRLPQECDRAIVQLADDEGVAVAHVIGPGLEVAGAVADAVPAKVCEAAARAMAPIREAGAHTASSSLPGSLRFLDAAGLDPPTPQKILARWAAGGRRTRALLGAAADGPFSLDFAEGSHLLVAGTTGSGKSELLQTLVASLAVANRPDAMNFVLIDYKGGATFRPCEPLPHTVGVLTDLDEFAVDRALTSLRAELQRRKAVLERAGKTSIDLYWETLPAVPGADPLPRLMIVVDEFAVMAEKLPDQLTSLIQIGAQGRSLGIHLVLATQRPAGVVSADMRANINHRIALRVASPEDSRDVIETIDAARIPAAGSAGRAYAWQAGGGRPVAFQAARVGGLRPGARPDQRQARTVPLDWWSMGLPVARPEGALPDPGDPTDLSALVAAIQTAAEQAEAAAQRSPWRPPLPEVLALGQLPRARDPLWLVYGLADRPRTQEQVPAVLDIARGGHLLVAGAPQSGRTTLLRTLAGCVGAQAPDGVHLYAVDCGGGLAALSALPQCGAVVTPAEPDRIDRLLARLSAEVELRMRFLSAEGYSTLAEYREAQPSGRRPPFLLVLVDRYDAFVTSLEHVDGGRLVGQFQRLVRDGLAAGVRAVVTGDRSLLTGRLGGWVEDKIILRLADRSDYAIVGLSTRSVPPAMPGGRGIRMPGGDLLQVAVLTADAQGATENRALRDWAGRCPDPAVRPFRVDPLPTTITYDQACGLPGPRGGILVGVGGDDLGQLRVDTPGLLVIGQPGSGRSTALAVQALSLAAGGAAVVLVTPRRSALTGALDPAGLRLHLTATDAGAAGDLRAALAGSGPAAVVVDDAELLADTPLGEELVGWCRGIRDTGHRVLAATTPDGATGYRGFVAELAKLKCGLVLEPASPADAGPLGARLPLSVLAGGIRLRSALVRGGVVVPIQVPAISDSLAGVRPGSGWPVLGVDGGSAAW
jgi:DNA segregation ATPase FtsK/SpoIIIE, S-DNA-T family